MAEYYLVVAASSAPVTRRISAEDDTEARDMALTELLVQFDIEIVSGCQARLERNDGSNVWRPDLVANLIS